MSAERTLDEALQEIRARAAQMRRFLLQAAVDVSRLDADQRKEHERNVEVDGKFIQSMQAVRNDLRLKANKRTLPGLPAK